MDRRRFLVAAGTAFAAGLMPIARPRAAGTPIRVAGPWASVSFPLAWMASRPGFDIAGAPVEFVPWRDPDELRLIAIEGRADFLALPANVAANLHNRGVALQLRCISAWGLLYLVSADPGLHRIEQLRGLEVGLPFRGDMPEIVLGQLVRARGMTLRDDLQPHYLASPLDAVQMLLTRRLDHALLSEPAVSMALRRSRAGMLSVLAPELHRAIDLQQAWADAGLGPARLPQAGIAALGAAADDAGLCAAFDEAHERALAACLADPEACGALVAERSGRLDAAAVADSLTHSRLGIEGATAARPALEAFFARLLADQPGLVGGRLPSDAFYGTRG